LAAKTSLPLGDCREFIGKLGDNKCLNISPAGSAPAEAGLSTTTTHTTPKPSPALGAAIRPQPASPSAPQPAPSFSAKAAATDSAGQSLFSRIRSRLGFLGKAAT
jgi:hypothetical protein